MKPQHTKAQPDRTPSQALKATSIIKMKLANPSLNLKEISEKVNCSHPYARHVWSDYIKKVTTTRGGPSSPFSTHGSSFCYAEVPPRWIDSLALSSSVNRNGQKVFLGKRATMVFHKDGDVFVYPFYIGWDEEVRKFLASGWDEGRVKLFVDSLKYHGPNHIAFNTPGIPKNYKVRIKGVGSFITDSTPYPAGSTEFILDPELNKNIDRISQQIKVLAQSQVTINQQVKVLVDSQILLNAQITRLVNAISSPVESLSRDKPKYIS